MGEVVSVVTFPAMRMFPLKGGGWVFWSGVTGVREKVDGWAGTAGTTGTKAGLPMETRPEATTWSCPPTPPTPSAPELAEAVPPEASSASAVTEGWTATERTVGSSWQPETASRNRVTTERRRRLIRGTLKNRGNSI
jgi:hypothetical protein